MQNSNFIEVTWGSDIFVPNFKKYTQSLNTAFYNRKYFEYGYNTFSFTKDSLKYNKVYANWASIDSEFLHKYYYVSQYNKFTQTHLAHYNMKSSEFASKENDINIKYFIKGLALPSFSALVEKSVIHPIDTTVTILQVSKQQYNSAWSVTKELFKQPLKSGFYKGFSTPVLLGSIPVQLSKYGSYEFVKEYFIEHGYGSNYAMGIGSLASAFVTTLIFTPIEGKRTRDTLNIKIPGSEKYNIKYLYSGGISVFLKGCFHMPIALMGTEMMQKNIDPNSGAALFYSGMITGAVAQFFTTPLDVLKTKMMQDVFAQRSMLQHIKDIFDQGIMFHSLGARMVRMGLGTGVFFYSMDFADKVIKKVYNYEKTKGSYELKGISNDITYSGLQIDEVEYNLSLLKNQVLDAHQSDTFYIEHNVINIVLIKQFIQKWYDNGKYNHYASIIALSTMKNYGHAVLMYATKTDSGPIVKLIDPMPAQNLDINIQLEFFLKNLKIQLAPNQRIITDLKYAGLQDISHATCGDMSLIMLQKLVELHALNDNGISLDKAIISNKQLINQYNQYLYLPNKENLLEHYYDKYFILRSKVFVKKEHYKSTKFAEITIINNDSSKIETRIKYEVHYPQGKALYLAYKAYKFSSGIFKVADIGVDLLKFAKEPTLYNVNQLTVDAIQIYNIYEGYSYLGSISTAINVGYEIYNKEYLNAGKSILLFSTSAIVPYIANLGGAYTAIPYYIGIMMYMGYASITNMYKYYLEYTQEDYSLKSEISFLNIKLRLCDSLLNKISIFSDDACFGFLKSRNEREERLKIIQQKLYIKEILINKGKFETSLYDKIYEPFFQQKEKLAMSSNMEEHNLFHNDYYDVCLKINKKEHYYCANESLKVIDHVLVTENGDLEIYKHDI